MKPKWLELTLLEIIEDYKGGDNEPLDGDEVDKLVEHLSNMINLQEGNITFQEYKNLERF